MHQMCVRVCVIESRFECTGITSIAFQDRAQERASRAPSALSQACLTMAPKKHGQQQDLKYTHATAVVAVVEQSKFDLSQHKFQ